MEKKTINTILVIVLLSAIFGLLVYFSSKIEKPKSKTKEYYFSRYE
jgi:uncharacterized protein YpmB